MYYKSSKRTSYKVRKHWIKNLLDLTNHMNLISRALESYAFYLDEKQGIYMIECVNDVIAYITELAVMFGDILNSRVVIEENTPLGAIINAFQDDCRPDENIVKRIMKGIKQYD